MTWRLETAPDFADCYASLPNESIDEFDQMMSPRGKEGRRHSHVARRGIVEERAGQPIDAPVKGKRPVQAFSIPRVAEAGRRAPPPDG
jgi:hypothetical protein